MLLLITEANTLSGLDDVECLIVRADYGKLNAIFVIYCENTRCNPAQILPQCLDLERLHFYVFFTIFVQFGLCFSKMDTYLITILSCYFHKLHKYKETHRLITLNNIAPQ